MQTICGMLPRLNDIESWELMESKQDECPYLHLGWCKVDLFLVDNLFISNVSHLREL